jgi:hypothetical protein
MRTGNEVLAVCTSAGNSERLACMAWIEGFIDGVQVMRAANGIRLPCLPDGRTYAQFRDVILDFLRSQPQIRPLLAAPSALMALTRAFPCPNSN